MAFDYSLVPAETGHAARLAAQRINGRLRKTAEDIIEIGRELCEQKERLGHGHFLKWIAAEFSMSERTARRFIGAFNKFGKSANVTDLQPSVVYALSAPSMPAEIQQQVIEQAGAGITVTVAHIHAMKAEWAAKRTELKVKINRLHEQTGGADRLRVDSASLSEVNQRLRKADQVKRLLDAWDAADEDARKEFLRRISAPVIPA